MSLLSLTTATGTRAAKLRYETRHFIDGKYVDSIGGGRFTVVNPATGAALCEVSAGSAADVDAAVASAKHAFASRVWSRKAPRERAAVLQNFARLIGENTERFACSIRCAWASRSATWSRSTCRRRRRISPISASSSTRSTVR
jgi:acyl-CoA reductase-like NAD-dependent aldehyde dehydrogenase